MTAKHSGTAQAGLLEKRKDGAISQSHCARDLFDFDQFLTIAGETADTGREVSAFVRLLQLGTVRRQMNFH